MELTMKIINNLSPSYSQRESLFIENLFPRLGLQYHFICLNGDIKHLSSLKSVLVDTVQNTDILHYRYVPAGSHQYQLIRHSHTALVISDQVYGHPVAKEDMIEKSIEDRLNQVIDFADELPLTASVFQWHDNTFSLLLSFHEIAFDSYSIDLFLKTLNDSFINANEVRNTTSSAQDILYKENKELADDIVKSQIEYWKKQLAESPFKLNIPYDMQVKEGRRFRHQTDVIDMTQDELKALQTVSVQLEIPLPILLKGITQLYLHKLCNQSHIITGTNATHHHKEVIGPFTNRVCLNTNIDDVILSDWLQAFYRLHETVLDNDKVPFGMLVDELHIEKSIHNHPLFQAYTCVQQFDSCSIGEHHEIDILHLSKPVYHYDMVINWNLGKENHIEYSYASELISAPLAELFQKYFHRLINNISALLSVPVTRIKLTDSCLPVREPNTASQVVNVNDLKSFILQFENQTTIYPDKLASVFKNVSLTYSELNALANQIAHYLIANLNIKAESVIAISCENPQTTLALILGIYKAGAAYVFIEPDLPLNRKSYVVHDARVCCVITDEKFLHQYDQKIFNVTGSHVVKEACKAYATDNLSIHANPNDLAYIIYTSGSSGKPKGVCVEYRALANLADNATLLRINQNSHCMQISSFSFDAAIMEYVLSLSTGATLYHIMRQSSNIHEEIIEMASRYPITELYLTPSLLKFFNPAQLSDIKNIIIYGEICPDALLKKWLSHCHVINAYGPTEIGIMCSCFIFPGNTQLMYPPTTIGKAINNTQLFVMDEQLNILPPGIIGELFVGSTGIARGYLGNDELTKKKFIRYIDVDNNNEISLYQTGDLVRVLPDGNFVFLGRKDYQVKLGGYRVELEEVDRLLENHDHVKQACTVCKTSKAGDSILVSYAELTTLNTSSQNNINERNVHRWQQIFTEGLDYQSEEQEYGFNITGWNSHYTNMPLSHTEMREWLHHTIMRIKSLKPESVLEIGCGTGMVLFNLAPSTKKYYGIDFSLDALRSIHDSMPSGGMPGTIIKLFHQLADDLSEFKNQFDTVVINSVIQYFPNLTYLINVIRGAMDAVQGNGRVFIGDVCHFDLQDLFYSQVITHKSPHLSHQEIMNGIEKKKSKETELFVSPVFFYYLKTILPRIKHVSIHHKRGVCVNELVQFRYDVTLHLEESKELVYQPQPIIAWHSSCSLEHVRNWLDGEYVNGICITGIPNRRWESSLTLLNQANENIPYLDPESFYQLGDSLNLYIYITYSNTNNQHVFDVIYTKKQSELMVNAWSPMSDQINEMVHSDIHAFSNHPTQKDEAESLSNELRQYLKQHVPPFMVPTQIVILDRLPVNHTGKLNREYLRNLPMEVDAHHRHIIPPVSQTEKSLAKIWSDLLSQSEISLDDCFYDLGGNSLLFISCLCKVQEVFDVKLSILDLVNKSLKELAEMIDHLSKRQVKHAS